MIKPAGIPGAQASAIGGIRRAAAQVDQSAADVAYAGARTSNSAANLSISSEGARLAEAGSAPARASQGGEFSRASTPERGQALSSNDIGEALVNSRLAKHLNAANVKVLQTAEQMYDDLGNIVRPKS